MVCDITRSSECDWEPIVSDTKRQAEIERLTQHVRYGHKWIPLMIEQLDEPRNYEQLKRDAENWRREVLGAVYAPTARSFQKEPKSAG